MTYNVHSCIGTDGALSVERIAKVIEQYTADIVCLQELDVGRSRTGAVDQALKIAELLSMEFFFHPALNLAEERYGDAVLSRHPLQFVRAGALPGLVSRPNLEPRGALWVSVQIDGVTFQLINTHLGLAAKERLAQIDALFGSEWLGRADCRGPVILCGDLNALPGSSVYRKVRQRLRDAQASLPGHWPKATFPSRFPLGRLDHVFVNEFFEIAGVHVPREPFVRVASDHLPLLVDLRFRQNELTKIPEV
jgi:endonuclease/exonuclease/phosphatase family metal-dependent hydrolase